MKAGKPLTADAVKPVKHKGHKAIRIARRKTYYASLPAITLQNKRRTLARQLRRFPEDKQARAIFLDRYGQGALDAQLERAHKKYEWRVLARTKARACP